MVTKTNYTLPQVQDVLQSRIKDVEIELARRHLQDFTQYTYSGFMPNWHHVIVCKEIDAWLIAEPAYNLLLTMPPRHGKSELCSIRLPAYIFGRWPDAQVLAASYSSELIEGMSNKCKRVILSPEYGDVFPGTTILSRGKRHDETAMSKASEWTIQNHNGHYFCAGIGGGFTGRGASIVDNRNFGIIDDPIKNREEAESKTNREKQKEWYKSVFRTRFFESRILMLMTRWHTDDLAGWQTRSVKNSAGADKWKIVNFPALFEQTEFTHPEDPRSESEALWPQVFDEAALQSLRESENMDSYTWAGLYQQRPSPPGGNKIKRHWIQRIHRRELPVNIQWVRFWDLAVTAKTKADFTASGKMGMDDRGNIYIDHLVHEQIEWPDAEKMIKAYANQEAIPVGIFTTGTQKGFFQALLAQPEMLGVALYAYNETVDKYTKAVPWIARAEAGKFHVVEGPGVDNYIDELVDFTGKDDTHDDQVDATSGAYQMFVSAVDTELQVIGEYEI